MNYKKYSKTEIILAIKSIDPYSQSRIERYLIDLDFKKENDKIDKEHKESKRNLAEYKSLVENFNKNGIEKTSITDIERMSFLLKKLTKKE